jgi:hypothetical protein
MEKSLGGPFPKVCPAVTLSHQNGRHSAVALLLKAALIQVSDYRLMGASGFKSHPCLKKAPNGHSKQAIASYNHDKITITREIV